MCSEVTCVLNTDVHSYIMSFVKSDEISARVSYCKCMSISPAVSCLGGATLTYSPENHSSLTLELVHQDNCSSVWLTNLILLIVVCIIFLIIMGIFLYSAVKHIQSTNEWKRRRLTHIHQLPIQKISSPIPMSRNPYSSHV